MNIIVDDQWGSAVIVKVPEDATSIIISVDDLDPITVIARKSNAPDEVLPLEDYSK